LNVTERPGYPIQGRSVRLPERLLKRGRRLIATHRPESTLCCLSIFHKAVGQQINLPGNGGE
jgi:hypothetical protein